MARLMRRSATAMLISLCFAVLVFGQADDKVQQAIGLFNQGQNVHEKGDLAAALEFYDKALELLPEFPEAELQKGSALVALGKRSEAERSFRRALEFREDWTLAIANLGAVLVDLGKFEEADSLLTLALEADEANSLALASMADLKLRTNASDVELKEVLAKLNALADKVRPTASILSAKAAIEYRIGDNNAATESAARAIKLDPKLRSANMVAADAALKANDIERAEAYIRTLEGIAPKAEDTIFRRARSLYALGKKADALALLQTVTSPSKETLDFIVEIKDGDVADLTGLEAKIQRTPDDVNALAKLCQGFRVSNPAKAIEYCRRASTLEPNEISHAVGFGAALVQAKHFDQAVTLFRKLLTIAPEHVTIRANLATALFQLKRYPEAKIEFRWLTEKQPASPAAYYFLGISHDQLGEYLDAMANYQQFLKLANAETDKLDIEKVNLRLPVLQRQIKDGKGKKK